MAEQVNMEKAKEVYQIILKMLDNRDMKYQNHEEDLSIQCIIRGDDLPMELYILVKPRNEVVTVISPMPFKMPEEKRVEGALAVCVANYGLVDGSFDYDLSDGEIRFRLTSSYRESVLSEELFEYMVGVSASTIDLYNDKFFMIAKDMLSVQDFIKQDRQ